MSVAVVGAGVVGVTTAAHIQDLLPNIQVTIVADKFNDETTSDGAAGLFYPAKTFKGPNPSITKEWIKYSYKYYANLLCENCGVFEVSGYCLSANKEAVYQNELMIGAVPEFRPATGQELLQCPGPWTQGVFVQTLIIRCRTFLPWLTDRIKSKGCKIIKKSVQDFSELSGQYDVIVNCTGLQSRQLCGDDGVIPIRGQVVKVIDPSVKQFFLMSNGGYIIPHEESTGIVTLGGTHQHGDWDTQVRPQDAADIREKCASLVPSLGRAPVAWEWVGLRPHRVSGVRLEAEIKHSLKLVHNYGHGGYGVTSAPGSGRDAALLVQQLLQQSK